MPNLVELNLGAVLVVLRENCVLVRPRGRRGFEAKHLTVFFHPLERDGVRRFVPHLTDRGPGARAKSRQWFPLAEAAVHKLVETLMKVVFAHWVAASSKADLAAMEKDGWVAFIPNMALMKKMLRLCRVSERRYRIPKENECGDLLREMRKRGVPLTDLTARPAPTSPIPALRIVRGVAVDSCSLCYYPTSWPGGEAGWYRTPDDWLPAERLERLALDLAGPGIRRMSAKILQFLGLRTEATG